MHGFCSQGRFFTTADQQSSSGPNQICDESFYVTSWVNGSLGCIKLERPQALNAMTLGAAKMVSCAENLNYHARPSADGKIMCFR